MVAREANVWRCHLPACMSDMRCSEGTEIMRACTLPYIAANEEQQGRTMGFINSSVAAFMCTKAR